MDRLDYHAVTLTPAHARHLVAARKKCLLKDNALEDGLVHACRDKAKSLTLNWQTKVVSKSVETCAKAVDSLQISVPCGVDPNTIFFF